jgi:hypothetical protein
MEKRFCRGFEIEISLGPLGYHLPMPWWLIRLPLGSSREEEGELC